VETARALFAQRGDEVQHAEIAREAGVGVGTVYRHFPTRQSLVEAAAEQRFAEILEFARGLDGERDGLARYLEHVGEVLDTDRGLSAVIEAVRGSTESEPRGQVRMLLEEAVAELIARDQRAGALSPTCTVADVYMITGALSAVIRTRSGDWRRFLTIVVDGLRPR
jgi:AcrR family transcriptional regulator